MWLTPASFFMLPVHAAYVLICVLVMNYDMSQYDMLMVLIFGAMHLFQVYRADVQSSVCAQQSAFSRQ